MNLEKICVVKLIPQEDGNKDKIKNMKIRNFTIDSLIFGAQ